MQIVITEFMDEQAVEALKKAFSVVYDPTLVERRERLAALLPAACALIVRNRTRVNTDLLAGAPRLKVVGRLGVGLDNIDLAACESRGIEVIPATGANANAVAEYVICVALMLLRRAYLSTAQVAAGAWPRAALSEGQELAGKTLGIVGFGSIGRLTARKAAALEMQVVAHDPLVPAASALWAQEGVSPKDLDDLLAESDVVSLHLPFAESTRGLFSRQRLENMKPGAILINTARGGIVDQVALAELLKSGRLGGAAIDVFSTEPLPAGSPLAEAPNLILTPHIAGVTRESNARVSRLVAEKVAERLRCLDTPA